MLLYTENFATLYSSCDTIDKLERELKVKEKVTSDSKLGSGDVNKNATTLQNILQIVQSIQQCIENNSKSLKEVTSHIHRAHC